MFCRNCGTQIPDGANACPNCLAVPTIAPDPEAAKAPQQAAQPVTQPENNERKKGFFNAPGKSGKSYAAIVSALLLLPAIFIVTIDYIWNYHIDWEATWYIVGALLVIWICSVLPAIRITPAPVTAIICFMSAALYVMYIVRQVTGSMEWFTMFALPVLLILAVFIGLDSALINSTKLRGLALGAVASAEAAIFSVLWGFLWDNYYHHGVIELRFSVICASGFLMLTVVLAALAYVKNVNKK